MWLADLTDVLGRARDPLDLQATLSGPERARAERIVSAERRGRWMAAHAMLRTLLGRYLKTRPSAVRIAPDTHGKPQLESEAHAPLSFNLSHSGPLALVAVASSGELGVDVELAGRPRDHLAIAERLLGSRFASQLEALAPERRERAFLEAWTRHEAAIKFRGRGLAPCARTGERSNDTRWVAQLELGSAAAGAVAAARAPAELHCWSWSGRLAAAR